MRCVIQSRGRDSDIKKDVDARRKTKFKPLSEKWEEYWCGSSLNWPLKACITAFFVNFSTYIPLRYLNGQIYWLSVPNALSETNICYSQPQARRRTFPSPPGILSGRRNAPIILIFASFEPIALFKTVLNGCLSKSNSWSRNQLSVKRKTVHFEKKKKMIRAL